MSKTNLANNRVALRILSVPALGIARAKHLLVIGLLISLCFLAVGREEFITAEPQGMSGTIYLPIVQNSTPLSILLFSKTEGFRHQSIPDAVEAISAAATAHDMAVTVSETAVDFTDANLAQYHVVVFLNTSGDVLDDDQQVAFERYIQAGGGFVGIHAASDTEYDWAWYGGLIGSYFKNHPAIQTAVLQIIETTHPSTADLPSPWSRTDEWYNFRSVLSPDITVLIEVDEGSYSGGEMGSNHPIAWYHEYDGGRSWYTAMGHTSESYSDPLFIDHIMGGIMWAADTAVD